MARILLCQQEHLARLLGGSIDTKRTARKIECAIAASDGSAPARIDHHKPLRAAFADFHRLYMRLRQCLRVVIATTRIISAESMMPQHICV